MVLGRGTGVDLALDGPQVSRRQARVTVTGGECWIEDLGSAAGTRVNGGLLDRGPRRLAVGDRIGIGAVELQLLGGDAGARDPRGAGPRPAGAALLEALAGLLARPDDASGDTLGPMLDALLAGLDAERAMVFVPAPAGGYEPAAARTLPGSTLPPELPVSRRLLAAVAAAGTPQLLDTALTAAAREDLDSIGAPLGSLLAAPLPLDGGAGVLYLDSSRDRRRFDSADRTLLVAFARAAGHALTRQRAAARAALTRERLAALTAVDPEASLVGRSPAAAALLEALARAAGSDLPVLVTGEPGSGKERVARALVLAGPRARAPFVAVPCAAIPEGLADSLLAGHVAGAFTGADAARPGWLELAAGGTLFLDEVDALPPAAQAKLAAALEDGAVLRLGGRDPIRLDLRLIAATRASLPDLVAAGRFRGALYQRLAGLTIAVPPLRERGEDLEPLARILLERLAREHRVPVPVLDDACMARLAAHRWPGNVRELANVLEAGLIRAGGGPLEPGHLLPGDAGPAPARPAPDLDACRLDFERRFVAYQLDRAGGNMAAAAAALGLTRRGLYKKCEELGIDYAAARRDARLPAFPPRSPRV